MFERNCFSPNFDGSVNVYNTQCNEECEEAGHNDNCIAPVQVWEGTYPRNVVKKATNSVMKMVMIIVSKF